jgi:hypothetical protein
MSGSKTVYTEGSDSTFTHMGKTYSVDELLSLTQDLDVVQLSLDKLKWMVEDDFDMKRMRAADTSVPVLVYRLPNRNWVTMDGYHRVVKAIRVDKLKSIPAKIVTDKLFQQLTPLS